MMKKRTLKMCEFAVVFLLLLPLVTQMAFASGGEIDSYKEFDRSEELFSALDDETKELLEDIGITQVEIKELFGVGFNRVIGAIFNLLTGSLREKALICSSVMGAMLVLSIVSSVSAQSGGRGIEITGYCVLALIVGLPLVSLVSLVQSVFVSALNFMKAFIPIYAAIIAASGKPVLALSFNTSVLALGEFIVYFVENIYAPFTGMIFCLAFVGGISDFIDFENVIAGIKKGITFILGLSATLFSGLLSIKGVLAASSDSVGAKGIRFIIGSSVPVVGNSVSEAFASVMAGLSLVKNTVGAFGIVAVFAIFLPVLIEIIAWLVILNISFVFSKTLGCNKESVLFRGLGSCLSLLLASTVITLVVLIVSCGIILKIA
ncbi:MAG: stage III sporulation protein AE [Acutalibacteraceae bacterium]